MDINTVEAGKISIIVRDIIRKYIRHRQLPPIPEYSFLEFNSGIYISLIDVITGDTVRHALSLKPDILLKEAIARASTIIAGHGGKFPVIKWRNIKKFTMVFILLHDMLEIEFMGKTPLIDNECGICITSQDNEVLSILMPELRKVRDRKSIMKMAGISEEGNERIYTFHAEGYRETSPGKVTKIIPGEIRVIHHPQGLFNKGPIANISD